MVDFPQGPSIGAIQSSMAAGVGGNPAAGSWVSKPMNPGAAATSISGRGYGSTPIPGIFGNLFNGGAFGMKPGQQGWLQKFAASVREDGAKAAQAANASLAQGAQAASATLQQAGVQIASADQIYGSAPGGGSWTNYVASRSSRNGGMDFT